MWQLIFSLIVGRSQKKSSDFNFWVITLKRLYVCTPNFLQLMPDSHSMLSNKNDFEWNVYDLGIGHHYQKSLFTIYWGISKNRTSIHLISYNFTKKHCMFMTFNTDIDNNIANNQGYQDIKIRWFRDRSEKINVAEVVCSFV